MEYGTRIHITPLPKKRFQRLCLRKNINSCPPKSVQSQNKENECHDMGLSSKKLINMSGRLSSPGCRPEHRTTPTFVTIRRPRHIIPSPLTTSGSNMDSDSSQFVRSGYFSTNSPKSVQKPYLAFSTPIDNNDLKHSHSQIFIDSDKVDIGKTTSRERKTIQIKSTNFPNGNMKMTKQNNDDSSLQENFSKKLNDDCSILQNNTTHDNNCTTKTFDNMESLNIFDKEYCTPTNNTYKTPENSTDILRKLTPQTASIMDNLYGDIWKSTPGLFKKTKSRFDPTQKLTKFAIDDCDIVDKLDLLQLNFPSTEGKSKHQPSQSSIKRFFQTSSKNILNDVASIENTEDVKQNMSHLDVVDNVFVLKDCLKNIQNDTNIENNLNKIVVHEFDSSKNDKLPISGLNLNPENPDDIVPNLPMQNSVHPVNQISDVINLNDGRNENPLKGHFKINDEQSSDKFISPSFQSLNDTDNFIFIRNPFLGAKNDITDNTVKKIDNLDLKTESKNILKEPNIMGKQKPKKAAVSENSTTGISDDAISCKPCHKNVVEDINEETQPNAVKCNVSLDRNNKQNKYEFKSKIKCTPEIYKRNPIKPDSKLQIEPAELKIHTNEGIKDRKDKSKKKHFEDLNDLNNAFEKRDLSLEMKLNNIADNYSKVQTKFSKPSKRSTNDPIKKVRNVIDNIKNPENLKGPKKLGLSDNKSNTSNTEILKKATKSSKPKDIPTNEKTGSFIKTKPNVDKDLKIGPKLTHRKNVDAQDKIKKTDDKVETKSFDTLINKETVKINSNLDDSCEILTTRKKKINYFHSSDSDDDTERRLGYLHFDLQPKTLIFDGDSGKDVKKNVAKKTIKERNSAKSLAISKENVVSNDTQVYSFMASLADNVPSWRCDLDAKCFKKNFKSKRDELTKKLFIMFNENVFESKLPSDLVIEWSVNLTKTAGRAHNKAIKHRSKSSVPPMITRKSHIELSAKVLDGTQRLRDTLAHELCHVATWLIDGQLMDGHGPCWKAWVARTLKRYPEIVALPVCHTLDIHCKYTYKCVKCGYSIGRHSKSIDTTKKRCGYCYGTLECIYNKKNKDGLVVSTPVGEKRQATGFALYVKENYGNVRGANTPHKEAMKYLGKQYAKMKIDNQETCNGK